MFMRNFAFMLQNWHPKRRKVQLKAFLLQQFPVNSIKDIKLVIYRHKCFSFQIFEDRRVLVNKWVRIGLLCAFSFGFEAFAGLGGNDVAVA